MFSLFLLSTINCRRRPYHPSCSAIMFDKVYICHRKSSYVVKRHHAESKAHISLNKTSLCYLRDRFSKMNFRRRPYPPSFSACLDNYQFNHPAEQCSFTHPAEQCSFDHPAEQCPFNHPAEQCSYSSRHLWSPCILLNLLRQCHGNTLSKC